MKDRKDEPKPNEVVTSLVVFMESYNKTIPDGFPHVSAKMLKQFRSLYPMLFRHGEGWSIDKHRKRLMDWLPSTGRV
jgi:hypothetical protein